MNQEMINFYTKKLERKESMLNRINKRTSALDYDMTVNENIQLSVLQAEVRMLKEVIEDFQC